MIVTSITPINNKKSKIATDDGSVFALYVGEIRKLQIDEGCEITDETMRSVIMPILQKRSRERVVYLLKDCDRPERGVREKLKDGFYPQTIIDSTIAWCKEKGYIDDERYVRNYVFSRGSSRSVKKIVYDLMQKGIKKETIIAVMEDDETDIDEDEQIRGLLIKKHYDLSERHEPDEKRKMVRFLAGRGYSWEAIGRVMREGDDI